MNASHTVAGIFDGPLTPNPCQVTITGSGIITIPSGLQGFAVRSDTNDPGSVTINNVLAGPGTLTAQENGSIYLNATNTYTGGTQLGYTTSTVFSGIIFFNNSASFGPGGIVLSECLGGALVVEGTNAVTIPNGVTNAANASPQLNIVGNPAGLTFSGPWTLFSGAVIGSGGATNNLVTISGPISGAGGITKSNPGILALSSVNTYTSPTIVSAGTLEGAASGSIPGNVIVNSGTLQLDNASAMSSGATLTLANSPGAGAVNLNFSGTQTIGALYFGATQQGAGTWAASGATHNNAAFTGSGVLNVVGTPPEITTQPVSQTNLFNTIATFSVTAFGPGPLTYQWQLNGSNIPNGIITTVAGVFTNVSLGQDVFGGYSGDNGLATNAQLSNPSGVAVDSFGNLFVADTGNNVIRKVGTNSIITTFAGGGTNGFFNGQATNVALNTPTCVALDTSGNLFIADQQSSVVSKVGTNGIITVFAGNGAGGYHSDNVLATNTSLYAPSGVAMDSSGNLFIADTYNNRIRKVATNGFITTVAGSETEGYSGDTNPATNAALNSPYGVAVDSFGNLFIADTGNNVIRMVGTNGTITTFAGGGTNGLGDGGLATSAALLAPSGVAVDAFGNLLIADTHNNRIRMVGTNGTITTVAGNGASTNGAGYGGEYSGDNGPATNASLWGPSGVTVDPFGNVFIADSANQVIRKVFLEKGPTLELASIGAANAGSYDVVVSNPYGSITSSVVTLQVLLPPTIVTQPQNQCIVIGSNATFGVMATGTAPFYYQWHFTNAPLPGQTNTTLQLGGVGYTNDGSYEVVVTNLYGSVTSAVAVLTVGTLPGITTQPVNKTTLLNSNASFSVAVSGSGPFTYQWQFNGSNLPSGIITTVAGSGTNQGLIYSPIGGAATNAVLDVSGVAVDSSGNLFIATQDGYYDLIAKVGTRGMITTVAGLSAAEFFGMAVDSSGNLFVADWAENLIRKVGTNGTLTTVAGNGTLGYYGDGGQATNAELSRPSGVAVDAFGDLFIADSGNNRIRKVGTNGDISTVAGGANGSGILGGFAGDNGPATNADLSGPAGVAVDVSGNLFIADTFNNRIRKVGTNGRISTVVGNGTNGYFGDNNPATNAELNFPNGVAADAAGNLFIADSALSGEGNNRIRKVDTDGIIATVAGNGTNGFFGDNGPAISAELASPQFVALDAAGNLFISDVENFRVREVFLEGPTLALNNVNYTNAGSYDVVVSSPYGSVTSSIVTLQVPLLPTIITRPQSQVVAFGSNTTLSIAFAGAQPLYFQWLFNGTNLTNNVQITGSQSSILTLSNVSVGNSGTYQIVVTNAYGSTNAFATLTVLPLTPVITWTNPAPVTYGTPLSSNQLNATASISGSFAYSPANGAVLNAVTSALSVIFTPTDSVDYNSVTQSVSIGVLPGALTVTANNLVRAYEQPNPTLTGTITGVTNGDNITAAYSTTATISSPAGMYPVLSSLVDPSNRQTNYTVTLANGTLTVTNYPEFYTFITLAGLAGSSGNVDGTGSAARFNEPLGLAVDSAGNLYVAGYANGTIRKVTPNGVVTTLAATFSSPVGVAADTSGNLYVANDGNNTISKVTPAGTNWMVTTLASGFDAPVGVAVDSAGSFYVGDSGSDTIRKVTAAGTVTTLAGLAGSPGNLDGTGSAARFNSPYGVAVDSATNVYVADTFNYTIRQVTPGGVVTTLAGLAGSIGSSDGFGSAARFNYPTGVAVDHAGNVYVADSANDTVRKLTPVGTNWMVTTIAGLAVVPGTSDGTGSAARFNNLQDLALDNAGNIYVTDYNNDTIRKGFPPAAPTIQSVRQSGSMFTFTWSAITNQVYEIQSTASLAPANWTNLSSPITASNSTMTNTQAMGTNTQQFYRVVRLP